MPRHFEVPAAFWRTFVDRHWNRKPVLLKKPFAAPIASAAELQRGLTRASETYRRGGDKVSVRVFADNAQLVTGLDPLLPAVEDRALSDYARRAGALLGGRRFGIVLNHYHRWDADHWLRARDFLTGLFELVGLPAGGATTDIFFGTYDYTPFGIHKDTNHVFTWVLEGRKRMLLWPFATFRAHPRAGADALSRQIAIGSHDYGRYRDSAIVLDGAAGDLMYWPPSYWHIAESVAGDSPPLTLAFGLEDFAHPFAATLSRLEQSAKEEYPAARRPARPSRDGAYRAARAADSARAAIKRLAGSARFEFDDRAARMTWISGSGFNAFPANWEEPAALRDDDIVSADTRFPLLWMSRGSTLACAANGHGWTMRKTRETLGALSYLAGGPQGTIRNLMRQVAHSRRRDFRGLLDMLRRSRWLLELKR